MAIDNRTSNRDYPKPNVSNLLSEDVVRLEEALDDIDTDVAAAQSSLDTKAPVASPTFTGTPAAPTPAVDTDTTQLATTAFVKGQTSTDEPVMAGTAEAGSSSRFARADHRHPIDTSRAPVASPTFTGTPAAPTPAADTNTAQLATTAFVVGQDYTKQTRQLFAGTGLTGGGDLSANRTLAADVATQAEAEAGTSAAKLMTPQRTAQAIVASGALAGMRNRIINGGMDIAQRGTSFAGISNNAYSLDRWRWGQTGTMVCKVSQSVDVPNNTFQSSYKVGVTTVDTSIDASDVAQITQRIEGYNVRDLIGTTFALSFWVKSPKIGTHCVAFRNNGFDKTFVKEYTIATKDTWEYKTLTVTNGLITGGTWNWTNGTGLNLTFVLAAGPDRHTTADAWQSGSFMSTANQVNLMNSTANEFFITGVQLEPGAVATPFERRIYGQELALCQRYYTTIKTSVRDYNASASAKAAANHAYFPATMRTTPTVTMTSAVEERLNVDATYPQASNTTAQGFTVTIQGTAGNQEFYDNGRNWTASAEL